MPRVWPGLRRVLATLLAAAALGGLMRLYAPTLGPGDSARRQLASIRSALDHGAARDAQASFPEGYFFLYALYGLAWVDVGRHQSDHTESLREARWALARLEGPEGTAPFSPDLSPAYGVFYAGWTNWLRGGILSLQPDGPEAARFDETAQALAAAFDASPTPFLQAYPGQSWPVDSTVAVASLRLRDTLRPARYTATIERWVAAARRRLDPATGLLPHVTDPRTGEPLQGARASSQSVIARFLPDVDPVFAREQYLRFRGLFVVRPLGIGPAVREYPRGTDGAGDVDSGPLLLGVSLSATVVTIGAARVEGDDGLAAALSSYGELAGVPIDTWGGKRYALGQLPIGDAFLLWARTAERWTGPAPDHPPAVIGPLWKIPLTVALVLLGGAPWLIGWARRRRRLRPPPATTGIAANTPRDAAGRP